MLFPCVWKRFGSLCPNLLYCLTFTFLFLSFTFIICLSWKKLLISLNLRKVVMILLLYLIDWNRVKNLVNISKSAHWCQGISATIKCCFFNSAMWSTVQETSNFTFGSLKSLVQGADTSMGSQRVLKEEWEFVRLVRYSGILGRRKKMYTPSRH